MWVKLGRLFIFMIFMIFLIKNSKMGQKNNSKDA